MRIIYFLFFGAISIECYSQDIKQEDYVYRLRIKNKNSEDITIQTGFIVDNENGMYTALHGVVGSIDWIIASNENTKKSFKLKLNKVDIEKDIAFLVEIDNKNLGRGITAVKNIDVKKLDRAKVIGHPYGVAAFTNSVTIGSPAHLTLTDLIPSRSIKRFQNRSSPSLDTQVIKVDGPIVRGHSGAPILAMNNTLIGIISGGLAEGIGEIAWCIQFNEIHLEPITKGNTQIRLNILASKPKDSLFSVEVENSQNKFSDATNQFSNVEQYLNIEYIDLRNSNKASINKIHSSFAANYSILFKRRIVIGIGGSFTGLSFLSQRVTLPNVTVNDTVNLVLKPRIYIIGKYYFTPQHTNRNINFFSGFSYTIPDSFNPYIGSSLKLWKKHCIELKAGYSFFNINNKEIVFNLFGDSNYINRKYYFSAFSICGSINFNLHSKKSIN